VTTNSGTDDSKLGETLVKLCDQFNATVGRKGDHGRPVSMGATNDLKQKTTAAITAGTAAALPMDTALLAESCRPMSSFP
jgi:hypothetical protein